MPDVASCQHIRGAHSVAMVGHGGVVVAFILAPFGGSGAIHTHGAGGRVILIDYHKRGRLLAKVLWYLSEINKTELNSTLVAWIGQ